jgi:2-amino-4-hydroxy-6-hydroxymethyldihydropteridine diphosphokinase
VEDSHGNGRHRSSLAGVGAGSGPSADRDPTDTWAVSERPVRAYIGLGANVGDAEATLAEAVRSLAALPGATLRGVSRLYATDPVGVVDQPEFRNAVVALDVPPGPGPEIGAVALLSALKALERDFGRQPRGRWGPRELDLDLLVFGRARVSVDRPAAARSNDAESDPAKASKLLQVPHPAAASRLFVLAPLADLAPRLAPPGWGRTVEAARRHQEQVEGVDAVRAIGVWDARRRRWKPRQGAAGQSSQPR